MEYKNKTKKDLVLMGYGKVKAGATIKTNKKINNANFEEVSVKKEEEKIIKDKEIKI
ncbi:hypothetical protein [Methanoculleus sp.]|jgi:hypothetical protein|uniref:hypothetical protein n=1 Tax=Methanoculleus sp. TaxID=90427 RepID=UPI0025ECF439|nr:hypothetical protein [Methanoculleus sp.]MCK9318897.1 hypothetical protein [Methanoculleus sp.]